MEYLKGRRHGVKSKKDQYKHLITQEGLDQIQKQVIGEPLSKDYTDLFMGPLYRTPQSELAEIAAIGCKARVHFPIEEVGTDEAFDEMVTPEFKDLVKNGATNLEALQKTLDPEIFKKKCADFSGGVEKMFSLIQKNGVGLVLGHDPIISMWAINYGYTEARSLKELEYIIFAQNSQGQIRVVDIDSLPAKYK